MTTAGKITSIAIASGAGARMTLLDTVEAIAGAGLQGDRYANKTGFYSQNPTTAGAREVTLIAEEDLSAVMAETGVQIEPGETRRNLTTSGVDLDSLIGRRFAVGEVVMEGVRRCPPCIHLEEITGKPLMRPLVRRGGLRARVVVSGTIEVGDLVTDLSPAEGLIDTSED